jgi:hypothetical protein
MFPELLSLGLHAKQVSFYRSSDLRLAVTLSAWTGGKNPERFENFFNLCRPMKRMDLTDFWLTTRFGLYVPQLIEESAGFHFGTLIA